MSLKTMVALATILPASHALGLSLTSNAFRAGGEIPRKFTCQGADISPPLAWTNLPPRTKTLALIVDDPDAPDPKAPKTTWVHWVLFNLPVSSHSLAEGIGSGRLPVGTVAGRNDWGVSTYKGPCPPVGRHRYFFKLYALDGALPHLVSPTKSGVVKAMENHVLASGMLMGTYEKVSGK